MITNTTNDVAILLVATGIKPIVTLSDMTVYMPGKTTFTDEEGEMEEESAVYKICDGFVTEAGLKEPISILTDESGKAYKLFNYTTRKRGWFNGELTDIDWE